MAIEFSKEKTMKIILDCFGGDNCPGSAIDGGLLALSEDKE